MYRLSAVKGQILDGEATVLYRDLGLSKPRILTNCGFEPGPWVFDECNTNRIFLLLMPTWISFALITCGLYVTSPMLKSPK